MAGGVCSFRTNPQRALFPTSSRKTKVRPPYILQQWKDYSGKLLNWFTSCLQFPQSLVFSLHRSVTPYPLWLLLLGGVPACVACAPSSKTLLSRHVSSADFLLFLFNYTASQISVSSSHPSLSHYSSYPFALQKDCPSARGHVWLLFLLFKRSFSPPFSSFNHPPKYRIAFGKILVYMAFKKKKTGRKEKSPFPFQTNLIIHVPCLLSLCSCLRALRVFWKYRIHPFGMISPPWYTVFSKFLITLL